MRVATELIASYREWSWEARSQLSDLVEQALRDYQERCGRESSHRGACADLSPSLTRPSCRSSSSL